MVILWLERKNTKFFKYCKNVKQVQVSLAICGGYVLDKSQTENTKIGILGLNKANLG